MKPKLLIIELWGLGDLVIATPFLRAASEKYDELRFTFLLRDLARGRIPEQDAARCTSNVRRDGDACHCPALTIGSVPFRLAV